MENNSSFSEIITNALTEVQKLVDGDTVIGKPIVTAAGVTIIPITKISLGMATGGLDLPQKNKPEKKNFGGGGGTGLTVVPVAFLTVTAEGKIELLPMPTQDQKPIDQLAEILDRIPELINKAKDIFSYQKKAKSTDTNIEDEKTNE